MTALFALAVSVIKVAVLALEKAMMMMIFT
jgi:hypothetical protein